VDGSRDSLLLVRGAVRQIEDHTSPAPIEDEEWEVVAKMEQADSPAEVAVQTGYTAPVGHLVVEDGGFEEPRRDGIVVDSRWKQEPDVAEVGNCCGAGRSRGPVDQASIVDAAVHTALMAAGT
jgi:hypothetical protein